jgi:hypothetical protein
MSPSLNLPTFDNLSFSRPLDISRADDAMQIANPLCCVPL